MLHASFCRKRGGDVRGVLLDCGDRNTRTLGREPGRDAMTDPLVAPGDEHGLAFKALHHIPSPLWLLIPRGASP